MTNTVIITIIMALPSTATLVVMVIAATANNSYSGVF